MAFTHLHVHTHFSFGLGVASPEQLVAAAAARGYTALACTDTNGVSGAMEFQHAAEAAGLRPILGAHLVTPAAEAVVLAEDARGWGALCRAVTALHWAESPEDGTAAFDLAAQLAADRAGLVVLSRDPTLLARVAERSGPQDLFAELRPGRERQAVLAAARRLGLRAVATNPVVMAHPEEWTRHRLLRAIHRNATLSTLAPEDVWPREAWLRPADDVARFYPDCPEALDAAAELAERCRYRFEIGTVVPPRMRDVADAAAELRRLAYAGAERRYGTPITRLAPLVRARLEHELAIIEQKRFADYFLVVRDIVERGTRGVTTHCGRGSVANSMVSYCLGITHVEPLAAGLLFERFLNPARTDPPDIDLDFPWDERDAILAYVFRRWPRPQAAMVANVNCLRLRGALREVAKVHGRPAGEIREVTRRIPWYADDVPLAELLAEHPNFQGLDLPAHWQDLARQAQPLVGLPRHLSLHPGGVVIVPTALTDHVPVERAAKTLDGHPDLPVPVIQFDKDAAEDAGLVKIDLLGNRSLAVIRDAIRAVERHTGVRIDYTSQAAGEDAAAKALFREGRTMGVFYTESPASRLLCAKSRADSFELLVLNTSIIRPASNRYIRDYLARLHGEPWAPLDPCLRDVLAETFGVMVYQEDVVNVCAAFAGLPLATGDGLRKALAKKRPAKQLAAYAEEFFRGALARGRDPEVAQAVWRMVLSFAGYSFCKGHSCSYIQVAQVSGALKAHHPAEFMAAVLANGGGFYHPFAYVAEAWRMGLRVLPPDVNASRWETTGAGDAVRIGLQFVKGLSRAGAERLVERRTLDGREVPYRSFADLRARAALAPADLRVLAKVGALDSIRGDWTRPMLVWLVDAEGGTAGRRDGGIFTPAMEYDAGDDARALASPALDFTAVPVLRDYPPERRRREECAALGFLTETHPMRLHARELARFRLCPSTALARHVGEVVLCAGLLTTAKPVHTLKDEPMEFATFDDGEGLIETVLFPQVFRERGHLLFDQGPFVFRGRVEEEFGAVTVTITHLERLERMVAKLDARRRARRTSGGAPGGM
ncbi:MAG TPA: DNA polymerase III subunit alpha [Gemmatimonadales bacterium]|nr:DNA polymerase III subunit alpha [Gemmatimonadales bacterium]